MDLAAHFRVIAQNWLRIILISVAIAVAVFLGSSLRSDTYEATAVMNVVPGITAGSVSEQETAKSVLARTYAVYIEGRPVLARIVRDSELPISLSEAGDRISASALGDLGFLEVSGRGPTRQQAETLTRYATQAIREFVINVGERKRADLIDPIRRNRKTIEDQLAALPADDPDRAVLDQRLVALATSEANAFAVPVDALNVFSQANAGKDPVAPNPIRDSLLAFLIALVVVSELTVLAHFVGDRFSGSEDTSGVADLTGLPVLAKIPKGEGVEVVEAFRVLRTNLMVLEGAGKPRTVAIVSANAGAGKTFASTHLAESAAGLEEKIVLIDGDLRKPTVHERLGVPRAPGLSSVLQGGDLTTALSRVPDNPYLRVLPSGAPVEDASGVLGARSFHHVLDALRAVRLVIVDTPPAALFADAMAVASQCDATIFVLDVKTSRRRAVRTAVEQLERAGANLIGVVINRATVQKTASYYEG